MAKFLEAGAVVLGLVVSIQAADTAIPDTSHMDTLSTNVVWGDAIEDARMRILPGLGATSYTLDRERISVQSQGETAPFDQTFYRFPGVAQDELDKRLHVRGEEANLQYRIDGFLVPDGLSGFGQELSTEFLRSVSLITGVLPAQFGNRTSGIVDMQTRTGEDLQGGEASLHGGSYQTISPSVQYGGNGKEWSGFGTADYLHDGLGMSNPDPGASPIHDRTDQYKAFGDISWALDSRSRLLVILSGDYSRFQIPNIAGQTPQYSYQGITTFDSRNIDENQNEQAYYEILGYQRALGDIGLQITQSTRYSDVSFRPDVVADVMFQGIASNVDHRLVSNNLQADAVDSLGSHVLRAGLSFSLQQARIDNTSTVLPATWEDSAWVASGDVPETIVDNTEKTATLYGAYLQDEWKALPSVTVDCGLRLDAWRAYIDEYQVSPRLSIVYEPASAVTLHAGYGLFFTPPPLELVQSGDVSKFNNTTNGADPAWTTSPAVRSERYQSIDAGIDASPVAALHTSLDGYCKIKKYTLDEGQFGPAMIFSPNNASQGLVAGVELAASCDLGGFSVYGNLSRSQAMAKGLVSGQFQFEPDEIAYMRTHWYHLDHDQDWTASAGASYRFPTTRIYADLLYGSGLYGGFCNETELPSYATVNVGAKQDVDVGPIRGLGVRLDIVNVADLKYEIRDGDGIGVFAPQYLPRRSIYLAITKSI